LHLIAVKDLAGKFSAVPADTLKHCALKLWIATSAALCRWHPGGTSSSVNFYLFHIFWNLIVQRMLLRLYTFIFELSD
jgi:hypothetical protein